MRRRNTPYAATPDETAAIDEVLAEVPLALTADEHDALVDLLRQTIAADHYPLSHRIKTLKGILAKVEPLAARPEPLPRPKAPGEPSLAQRRKRRR